MLERVEDIEASRRQRPGNVRPGQIAAALRALAFAASDAAAETAYHRVLFAVGNNHAGTYFPVVLDVIPFLGGILVSGTRPAKARTLDALIDLVASFGPDPAVRPEDDVRPEELPAAVWARVELLRPAIEAHLADSAAQDIQALALELLDCLRERAAQQGVATDERPRSD